MHTHTCTHAYTRTRACTHGGVAPLSLRSADTYYNTAFVLPGCRHLEGCSS